MSSIQTFAIFFLLILAGIVAIFNRLVRLRNNLSLAWSHIEIQVQQKQELLPELMAIAEKFAREECETAQEMLRSRCKTSAIAEVHQVADSHSQSKQVLAGFLSISESYPDLLEGEAVSTILKSLANSDAKIALAKEYYNRAVSDYNSLTEMWPCSLVAKICQFSRKDLFDALPSVSEPNSKI